ncbi:MAG: hypothetical protein Q7J07_02410, partial [Pelolinea sp.]|nr:hypothetical protein [Pelolinea sp.]
MSKPDKKTIFSFGRRFLRGVTLQMFLVVVLPLIILVLIVTFGSLKLHYNAMRSLVADRNLRVVQLAADNLDKEITRGELILQLISNNFSPKELIENSFSQIDKDLSLFDGGAAMISSDGEIITFIKDNPAIRFLAGSPTWKTILDIISKDSSEIVKYLPIQKIDEKLFVPVLVSGYSKTSIIGLFSPEEMLSNSLATFFKENQVTVLAVDNQYQILYQYGDF